MATPMPATTPARYSRERRLWPRSPKNIRVLLLSEDSALDEPFGAWIIDTSRGGVRLRVPHELFPVGSLLHIRNPFASARVPWTALRVCHIRRAGDQWEVGCEFVDAATSDTTQIAGPGVTRVERI
jgi:hypothetical protein